MLCRPCHARPVFRRPCFCFCFCFFCFVLFCFLFLFFCFVLVFFYLFFVFLPEPVDRLAFYFPVSRQKHKKRTINATEIIQKYDRWLLYWFNVFPLKQEETRTSSGPIWVPLKYRVETSPCFRSTDFHGSTTWGLVDHTWSATMTDPSFPSYKCVISPSHQGSMLDHRRLDHPLRLIFFQIILFVMITRGEKQVVKQPFRPCSHSFRGLRISRTLTPVFLGGWLPPPNGLSSIAPKRETKWPRASK